MSKMQRQIGPEWIFCCDTKQAPVETTVAVKEHILCMWRHVDWVDTFVSYVNYIIVNEICAAGEVLEDKRKTSDVKAVAREMIICE